MAMVAAVLVPWGAEAGEATRQGVKLMDGVVATAAVMAAWALAGGWGGGEKRARVTWMDAAVAGLLAWEAAGIAWAWETVDREVVWRWAGTGMVYAAARACGWRGERWGWWTLLAAWAAQAGFGLAEATEGFRHWREWKGRTGSMGNSGIWSGFTACAGVAAWVCLAGSRRGWERGLADVMVAATAVALVAGDSRAAWLGYAAGCAGLIPRERMGKWRMVAIGAVAAAAVGIVVMVGARPERGASAEGRLLVWRVASEIWADHPWGTGADGFRRMYGRQQGEYLQRQGTERERMLADETREAFNEWVRRGVEGGIAEVLLAGAVAWLGLRRGKGERGRETTGGRGTRCAIGAWLVFGLFSYPGSIFQCQVTMAVLLAARASQSGGGWNVAVGRWARVGAVAGAVAVAGLHLPYRQALAAWEDCLKAERVEGEGIEGRLRPLRNHPLVLTNAAILLNRQGEHERAGRAAERAARLYDSYAAHVEAGIAAEGRGDDERAEAAWKRAGWLLPNRVKPLYYRMELYARQGEEKRAKVMAREILARPLKVRTVEGVYIRERAREVAAGEKNEEGR